MAFAASWQPFFAAEASASASLAGLVFVGVSVSLRKILDTRHLPGRALEAIALLALTLCVSPSALAPQNAAGLLGLEIAAYAIGTAALILPLQVKDMPHVGLEYRRWVRGLNSVSRIALAGHLALAVALGVFGWGALPIALPAALLCFLLALANAWIVLVEIHR